MGPVAASLHGGTRLHLQHGPIDLIIGADGERCAAFDAAIDCFATVLDGLVAELPILRQRLAPGARVPDGPVARRMIAAAEPFAADHFLTPMIAVAGAVADHVLQAMVRAADLDRAFVNNGGDIALHLTPGQSFTSAMAAADGATLGQIRINAHDAIRGIATSGRHGRSHSLGVADSVTVLARSAAQADVAATLIGNAVDPGNDPAVQRVPAHALDESSDLGALPVVVSCGPLSAPTRTRALKAGLARARDFKNRGMVASAALFLQGEAASTGGSTDQAIWKLYERT